MRQIGGNALTSKEAARFDSNTSHNVSHTLVHISARSLAFAGRQGRSNSSTRALRWHCMASRRSLSAPGRVSIRPPRAPGGCGMVRPGPGPCRRSPNRGRYVRWAPAHRTSCWAGPGGSSRTALRKVSACPVPCPTPRPHTPPHAHSAHPIPPHRPRTHAAPTAPPSATLARSPALVLW